jgi:hypothetical protein
MRDRPMLRGNARSFRFCFIPELMDIDLMGLVWKFWIFNGICAWVLVLRDQKVLWDRARVRCYSNNFLYQFLKNFKNENLLKLQVFPFLQFFKNLNLLKLQFLYFYNFPFLQFYNFYNFTILQFFKNENLVKLKVFNF